MLLHVIATHTEDNCVMYHRENVATLLSALEKREELARQFGVRLHYLVSAAPEHVFYALLEADSIAPVSRFVSELLPIPSDFKVSVVEGAEDLVAAWKSVAQK